MCLNWGRKIANEPVLPESVQKGQFCLTPSHLSLWERARQKLPSLATLLVILEVVNVGIGRHCPEITALKAIRYHRYEVRDHKIWRNLLIFFRNRSLLSTLKITKQLLSVGSWRALFCSNSAVKLRFRNVLLGYLSIRMLKTRPKPIQQSEVQERKLLWCSS